MDQGIQEVKADGRILSVEQTPWISGNGGLNGSYDNNLFVMYETTCESKSCPVLKAVT